MNKRFWQYILLALAIAASSCSGYEKLLRSKDNELKYQRAMEYYHARDHYRYTGLFEQLSPIYRGTQRADTIEFYLAEGHYHQGDYLLAGHYFNRFRQNFARSPFAEDATYMYAYCFYRASPRPQLDQESTKAAIVAFNEFITRYPRTDRRAEVNTLLRELKLKLDDKSFLSARLYYDMGDYRAAITALKNSLLEYPNTKHREEHLFLILDASFRLADNSIPSKRRERFQNTLDEYYNLMSEFPESLYKRDVERIHAAVLRIIEPDKL